MNIVDILNSRETGTYYIGDIDRDINDVLRDVSWHEEQVELAKVNQQEILAQLPEEDFLSEVIDRLTDCLTEKMTKDEIKSEIKKAIASLDDISQCQVNANGYAYSLKIT